MSCFDAFWEVFVVVLIRQVRTPLTACRGECNLQPAHGVDLLAANMSVLWIFLLQTKGTDPTPHYCQFQDALLFVGHDKVGQGVTWRDMFTVVRWSVYSRVKV